MFDSSNSQKYGGRKVLVLGDDYRMVLPIVRSLGRQGIDVHLGWCDAANPACRSHYATRHHVLPWYSSTKTRWIKLLNKLVEAENFDLVIPTTEHAVYALQTHQELLTSHAKFYLLDDHVFRSVIDKQATYELCKQHRIPYPASAPIDCLDDFDTVAPWMSETIVVKPTCSVNTHDTLGKAYVRCCRSHAEARTYVEHLLQQGTTVALQQHIDGEGVGVELIALEGRILTALQHRRLHETTGHGSTYRETVALDPKLLGACQRLMAGLGYTGVAMCEFRVNPRNGNWVLIEVNGRFWGSLPLAAAAGLDFPLYLYEMLVEGKSEFPQHFRVGVRSRAITNDMRWLWRRVTGRGRRFDPRQTHNLGWVTNQVPWSTVLANTLRGLTLRDHIDAFASDDVGPALAEVQRLCNETIGSLRTRIPSPSMHTLQQRLLTNTQYG